ncbi:hypothetical protein THMIRHAS_23140 [Thiosulfatimonas sediminis]|uniref:histidine kinase n=1 Tax=Thiosulfatimonas sediminis TaxID=2675054 RepID=A0A6F8PXU1_9GAMM|nr:ATP-binding protein [Thiosulfatimonas sediminis]BBP46941.1 hypothetical protein THMIRHAS_23140 [Thiosulfatimonas sediminis]
MMQQPPHANHFQHQMRRQSFDLVLHNGWNSLLGNFSLAVLSLMLVFSTATSLSLIVWSSVFVMIVLGRHWLGYHLTQKPKRSNSDVRLYGVMVYTTALMWGIFPWLFYQADQPLSLTILAIVIAGLIAGSVASLSAITAYIRGFLALTLLPLIALFLYQQQFEFVVFAIMMGFFGLFILNTASQFQHTLAHSIELNLQNQQLIDELVTAKQQAEEANQVKSYFMANISHELRTPLNAIVGFTDVLLTTPASNEQQHFLESIRDNATQLTQRINDILDFSKIEKQNFRITTGTHSPIENLEQTLQAFTAAAENKKILLEVEIEQPLPTALLFDAFYWKQVLSNLLSNALKFSNEHTRIEIKLFYHHDTERLYCSIRDYGVGIAIEKQQQIFEPFTQADNGSTRQYDGTGLGLSIAKELLTSMDGGIRLSSEIGQGSLFEFWISAPQVSNQGK